jgi:uncharacterized ubiquitin-like protein YukD
MPTSNQEHNKRTKRPSRKKFDRVNRSFSSSDDESDDVEYEDWNDNDDDDEKNNTNEHTALDDRITITILDSAQNKFEIKLPPDASVVDLKRIGCESHSIPPDQQRLVSMGQLLKDDKSIQDHRIADGSIVHLFPKPNVVVTNSSERGQDGANVNASPSSSDSNDHTNNNHNNNNNNNNNHGGAHVPQILMDTNEVNSHTSILVLSTHEAYETMHRIRLLSFLLLMYSSIQLLRDVSMYLAPPVEDDSNTIIPPGDPTDTGMPGQYEYDDQLPQWQNRDFIEMGICVFGLYVALLGIKSTSEHIGLKYSKRFMILLGILGTIWNCYLYYCYVDELKARESQEEYDSGKVFQDAFFAIALPLMLWVLFFLRSIQFYALVREAEMDAAERSRSLADSIVTPGMASGSGDDGDNGNGNGNGSGNNAGNNGEDEFTGRSGYDLEMQVDNRSIT